ncbi:ABC transporter substrate-binding protein [Amycolatopsis alkalitolerans]|uniref:ABC transporter substrate-binding protein n=1 Tax=Amycolatopsis alkalitolerans TaxID=2547244 RepID=A0A5C4M0L4_9PSEU|nr:ABC transporter substrate-binding protein [Amycolatopsis alkalitolerans]TNC25153.1 ABC transporter substrate-binding protein [Amycolatopsis alkalitolerans]
MKPTSLRHAVALVGAILCTSLAVAACGGSQPSGAGALKIAQYPGSLISFPARVAQAEGIFAKHHLNVSLIDVSGGPDANAAVVSGSADIQLNSMDNLMLARAQGQDMVAVSGNTTTPIFSVVVNNKFKGVTHSGKFPEAITALKGAKIGVTQRGASVELVMRYLLSKAGLNPDKDVTFVGVGAPPTAVPALQHGTIDAVVAFEPMQTQAVSIGKYATNVFDLRTNDLPTELKDLDWDYNQWAALKSNVDRKQQTFKDFQAAMKETYDFIADPANFNTLVDVGLKAIANDKTLVTEMLKSNLNSFGFRINQQKVENTSNFLLNFDKIKTPVAYNDIVDPGAR